MSLERSFQISKETVRRLSKLAERRRDYYVELYQSGRWKRYYDERTFLECVRQAKALAEDWQRILRDETEPLASNLPASLPTREVSSSETLTARLSAIDSLRTTRSARSTYSKNPGRASSLQANPSTAELLGIGSARKVSKAPLGEAELSRAVRSLTPSSRPNQASSRRSMPDPAEMTMLRQALEEQLQALKA
jgi:uncharacterized repeat protein (TIGR03809 family)